MIRWSDAEVETLRTLWAEHGGGFRKIAKAMGRSRGSIDGKSRVLGLQFRGGRARQLSPHDDAARLGLSTFPSRVVEPDWNVLKSGDNQRKLGRVVMKGRWKGFPIYSLTLEERATCPRTCKQWLSCYGLGMGHATRYQVGPTLERHLRAQLAQLQRHHSFGFVVRLHILGDFPSLRYVEFWRDMLATFQALHIFGYTARLDSEPIGRAINAIRDAQWDRFAIRTSGAKDGPRTLVIAHMEESLTVAAAFEGAIICPAQLGKTKNCASCALCWAHPTRDRPIAFLQH
jgi:hypothetical protein